MTGEASLFRSLGAIPPERFQRAADRQGIGRVLDAQALGGAHGNTVALRTAQGRWVLRGAVAPLDAAALRRERFFARTVCERSAMAAPWPYLVDESDDIFGWPYAIMRRLPGRVLHPGDHLHGSTVGRALGDAVAALHAVRFATIGAWHADVDDIVDPGVTAARWFGQRTGNLVQRIADTSSPLDAASRDWVDAVIAEAVPAIGTVEPTYVHGDLGIGNLVAGAAGDAVAFTGVFDLSDGRAADPDEDLATPLWWPLYWGNAPAAAAFLAAYRTIRPARPGQRARLGGYVVASLLGNWEAGRRQGFDWYPGHTIFREWAAPLLDGVRAIVPPA